HLDFLRDSGAIPREVEGRYLDVAQKLLDRIAPLFDGVATQRLHGDLHRMNLLWRPGEGFQAIDFDDTEHVSLDARFLAEGKGTGILRGTQMGNHPVVIHDDAVDLVL
ncbi:MAG: hypothetical protein CVV51_12155, partial [Spirochaetae bacterium HGW-Spirochaetae-7]